MHAMKNSSLTRGLPHLALLLALSCCTGLAFAADPAAAVDKAATPGAEIGNGQPARAETAAADCSADGCAEPVTTVRTMASTANPVPDLALRALLGMETNEPEC